MARQRTPQGPPPPPPVQRLRIRYAKRGRMRFSSTRDIARALERALRRAGIPMAFSAGFHPHPRISYANGAPTGAASEAEYVEIQVIEHLDPEAVREALDAALPAGLDIVEVVVAGPGGLADRLQASDWELRFRGVASAEAERAVAAYLAAETAPVSRMFKTGPKTFDTRAAVVTIRESGDESGDCAILRVVVRHSTPSVRPDDILTALRAVGAFAPTVPPLVTRLAQGPLRDSGGVADPLAADKEAVGS